MIIIKRKVIDETIIEEPDTQESEEPMAPSFDFSNIKLGLDALDDEIDSDEFSSMDEYEVGYGNDSIADVTNHVKEIEGVMSDEEIEDIISRFTRISDRKGKPFKIIIGMIQDFRKCTKAAAEKHGSWVFDTDMYDEKKDDVRMLTKDDATLIIDTVLAERLPTYVVALENFRKDSNKTFGFVVLGTVIMYLLLTFGFLVILPTVVFFGMFATVGNVVALIRDMKRTRLVIVKEIDRLQKTIASLDKNKDAERIKDLTAVMAVLMKSSGYSESDPKWKKLRDPEVVRKIMESVEYFGADVYGIDEIRVNILEADMDEELEEKESEPEPETKEEHESEDKNNEEPPEEEYGGASAEDALNELEDNSSFKDEGSNNEKEYKLKYVLSNLDELLNKYTMLYTELIASDPYKVIMSDENHGSRELLGILTGELEMAVNSLNEYTRVGDKSTYAIVALKLSTFQQLLVGINDEILKIIKKDMEEEV